MRILSSTALALSSIAVAFGAGCPVDPATLTPGAPVLDVSGECRNVNSIRVEGTKPAGSGIVGAVTDSDGKTTEFEVAGVDDATEFSGAVVVPGDGTYAVAFVTETSGGVRSKAVGPFTVVVDRTPPAAPTCTAPEPVEVASGPVSVDVPCSFADDVDAVEVDGEAVGAPDDTVPVIVEEGTQAHPIVAVDACGNRSTPASVETVGAADLTPPTGLTVDGPSEVTVADGATTIDVDFSGAKEAGATVAVAICPAAGCPDGTTPTDLPGDAAATTWTATLPLPIGAHLLAFVARDDANNEGAAVAHAIRVHAFLAVPTLSTTPPAATNATSLPLSGEHQAGTRVLARIAGVAEPIVLDDGTANAAAWSGALDLSGFVDVPRSPLPVTFSLFADDGAVDGDRSADSDDIVVEVDRTAPAAPVVPLLDNTFRVAPGTTSAEFGFSGTGEANATIVVDGVDGDVVSGFGTFTFRKVLTTTTTSVVVALRDAAGNVSPATTLDVAVTPGLFKPTLTNPVASSFPIFTRDGSLTLTGARRANCGTGPCGIEAVNAVDGTSVQVAAIGAGTTWTGSVPLVEGGNRFFLRAFDAATPPNKSDLVGLSLGEPFTVVKDTTPPAPPDPVAPQGTQAATVSFPILKGPDDGLLMRVNDEPAETTLASVLDGRDVYNLVSQPLVPGDNVLCFVTVDRVGNRSDDGDGAPVCRTLARAVEATLTLSKPQRNDVVNGSTLRVEAAFDRTATSFSVCVDASCQDIAASGTSLAATVDIGAAPAQAAFATVRVCANDTTSQGCATTTILRWPAPFVVSQSDPLVPLGVKNPQVAVDRNGFVHVVWVDENLDASGNCVAPHVDVVTQAARGSSGGASGKLVVTVSRAEGFAVGDHFRLVGAGAFDGRYTVGAVNLVTRTLTTTEGVAVGLPAQSTGNVFGEVPFAACNGPDVFYRRFDDAGWSDIVNLSDIGGDAGSTSPSIAVDDGNNVHILWQEDGQLQNLFGGAAQEANIQAQKPDVVHRIIDGITGVIGLPQIVTPNTSAGDTQINGNAAIATGAGEVIATWQESASAGAAGNIWLSRFDSGVWTTRQLVVAGTGLTPSVAIGASGIAYVAWSDNSAADRDIFLCRVLPGGGCEAARKTLVTDGPDAGTSTFPRVAVDNGRSGTADDDSVQVVWLDTGNGLDTTLTTNALVYERRYRPERILGATVSAITRVSASNDAAASAAVAANPGSSRVFVAWASAGPSSSFVDAAFPVGRSVGTDRDLLGQDNVFESSGFAAPTVITGATSGSTADVLGVGATTPDGRNAYVVFAHDPDYTDLPGTDAGAVDFTIVIHAVPLQ